MRDIKKLLSLLLALCMLFALSACRSADTADNNGSGSQNNQQADDSDDGGAGDTGEGSGNFKIAIVTGTLQDGEEEYAAAQRMQEQYPDIVVTACYPDNYATEPDTLIATYTALAADPDVKAIISVQAVAGTAAAYERVRETRDDIMFLAGAAVDAPDVIADLATYVLSITVPEAWLAKAQTAVEMGAEAIIYYSFPRHQSNVAVSGGRALMEEYCAEQGIEFVYVTTPDSQSEAGIYGVQQFVAEDVPRQIATYGPNTAFINTNCFQTEAAIQGVLDGGAIYAPCCCYSPLHKYPSAMGIDMSDHPGDVDYCMEQIQAVVDEYGMNGRVASASTSPYQAFVKGMTEYAIQVLSGETNGNADDEAFTACIMEAAGEVELINYEYDGTTYENYFGMIPGIEIY